MSRCQTCVWTRAVVFVACVNACQRRVHYAAAGQRIGQGGHLARYGADFSAERRSFVAVRMFDRRAMR